jgi:RNA polymerase sigma-70 factor (ECF subfamily)
VKDAKPEQPASVRAAIAELHGSLYPRVVRYIAVRSGDFAEAEDLASEVFVRALRSSERFDGKSAPLEAWIFRIAHNLLVDHLRARSRRPSGVSMDEDPAVAQSLATHGESAADSVEREEEIAILRKAMAQLTEAQQEVLALRFSDREMTSEQIAAVLGRKPTAVREMQSAAIKRLRTILGAGNA